MMESPIVATLGLDVGDRLRMLEEAFLPVASGQRPDSAASEPRPGAATAPEPSCENAAPVFPPDLGSRGPRHGGPGRHETPSSDQMEARGSLEPRRCTVSDSE